jgi:hypothetical protein
VSLLQHMAPRRRRNNFTCNHGRTAGAALICGVARSSPLHRLQLRPSELHVKEEDQQTALDPAEEILGHPPE